MGLHGGGIRNRGCNTLRHNSSVRDHNISVRHYADANCLCICSGTGTNVELVIDNSLHGISRKSRNIRPLGVIKQTGVDTL